MYVCMDEEGVYGWMEEWIGEGGVYVWMDEGGVYVWMEEWIGAPWAPCPVL